MNRNLVFLATSNHHQIHTHKKTFVVFSRTLNFHRAYLVAIMGLKIFLFGYHLLLSEDISVMRCFFLIWILLLQLIVRLEALPFKIHQNIFVFSLRYAEAPTKKRHVTYIFVRFYQWFMKKTKGDLELKKREQTLHASYFNADSENLHFVCQKNLHRLNRFGILIDCFTWSSLHLC